MQPPFQPLLTDIHAYRRFLSDTAGGIFFIVALLWALPSPWWWDPLRDALAGAPAGDDGLGPALTTGQMTLLVIGLVAAGLVVGPIVNAVSFALEHGLSTLLRGHDSRIFGSGAFSFWRMRILHPMPRKNTAQGKNEEQIEMMISCTPGSWFLSSRVILENMLPATFMRHERYYAIDILCRSSMATFLTISVVELWANKSYLRTIIVLMLAILLWYIGQIVAYFRLTRHYAAVLALAAATGDSALIDKKGKLPKTFRENPDAWYGRLFQHYGHLLLPRPEALVGSSDRPQIVRGTTPTEGG